MNTRLATIAFALLLCSVSCAGKQPAESGIAEPISLEAEAPTSYPALPVGDELDFAGVPLRQSKFADFILVAGHETYRRADNALIDPAHGSAKLYSNSEPCSWAMYQFGFLLDGERPEQFAMQIEEPYPGEFYLGVSDFASASWHWIKVENVSGKTFIDIPQDLSTIGSDGRVFAIVAAPLRQFIEIASLALMFDVHAPPPPGLTATDSKYITAIRLNWLDPAEEYAGLEYDSIQVLRFDPQSGQWPVIAELPAGSTQYFDVNNVDGNVLPYDEEVLYSVRTVAVGQPGPTAAYIAGKRRAPVGVFIASKGEFFDRVKLQWQAQPGVEQYSLDYKSDADADWFELATVDGSLIEFAHLWNVPEGKECAVNTNYYYRLRPDTEGDVAWLPTAEGYRSVDMTDDLSASYGEYADRIVLSWTDANESGIGYKIYRDGQEAQNLVADLAHLKTWTDYAVDEFQHLYWVQPYLDTELYDFSPPAVGIVTTAAWQYHDLSTGQTTSRSSFALIDGKPAVAYYTKTVGTYPVEYDLRFAIAATSDPSSSADWQHHVVDDDSVYVRNISNQQINGAPGICYWRYIPSSDTYTMAYARATTSTPTGPADWQIHELDIDSGDYCSLIEVNGKPVITYGNSDSELWYLQALTSAPSSSSDWLGHNVAGLGLAPHAFRSIAVIDGKPVIAVVSGSDLYCVRALTSVPTSSADWASHAVNSDGIAHSGCSITEYNGAPAIAYVECDSDFMMLALAANPIPASSADWSITPVDYVSYMPNNVSLVAAGGLLGMVYFENDTGVYRFAQATTADPQGLASWQVQPICTLDGYGSNAAAVIDDHPVVVVVNNEYAPRYCYKEN